MKYIVVYIIFILGLSSLNTAAQKPSIDLLPTSSASVHPETLIDTSITHDSLILFKSLAPLGDSISRGTAVLNYGSETSADIGIRPIETEAWKRPGLYPLIFKKINPISFIIFFTALKF